MNEAQTKAQQTYDNAFKEVQKQLVGKPGFGAEARYAEAYQGLVSVGLAPQLKRKYRP